MSSPCYLCQRCTNCCRWPGLVRINEKEVREIAAFLGCSEYEFVQQYTALRPDRRGLMLLNHPDDSCIFLKGRDCSIQKVKPQQCRDFPNGWNFPGWREVCEAIEILEEDEAHSA